jgi:hypothetical protein
LGTVAQLLQLTVDLPRRQEREGLDSLQELLEAPGLLLPEILGLPDVNRNSSSATTRIPH